MLSILLLITLNALFLAVLVTSSKSLHNCLNLFIINLFVLCEMSTPSPPIGRCHLSNNGCPEAKRVDNPNWYVLCCVVCDICTQWCTHTLNLHVGFRLSFVFRSFVLVTHLCVCFLLTKFMFTCFLLLLHGFSVFSSSQKIGWGKTSPKLPILCQVERKYLN